MVKNCTDTIIAFAESEGIIVGACDAKPLFQTAAATHAPFVSRDIARRTDPKATLKTCESVIVIGVPQPCDSAAPAGGASGEGAFLSSLGRCDDYHVYVRSLLEKLAARLGATNNKILVDSAGLDERAFAVRAGLGFYGRSGLVVCKEFGTRWNIGLLLVDFRIRMQRDAAGACPPGCARCIAACPGGALGGETLDFARCVSYLTQKEELTLDEEKLIARAGQIYGCDICQEVCPYNSPRETVPIQLQNMANISDQEFEEKYSRTAMNWRGADILRRNAGLIAAQNAISNQTARNPCRLI